MCSIKIQVGLYDIDDVGQVVVDVKQLDVAFKREKRRRFFNRLVKCIPAN